MDQQDLTTQRQILRSLDVPEGRIQPTRTARQQNAAAPAASSGQ